MEKNVKVISVVIVALIILFGIILFVSKWENFDAGSDEEDSDNLSGRDLPSENGGRVDDSLYQYFSRNLRLGAVNKTGQPIEGFTPQIFMAAYPVLRAGDFEGVEAQSGVYRVVNGEVAFDGVEEHTASEAISVEGEKTLLDNLSRRFQIPAESEQQVDLILGLISGEVGIV